jgi:fructokinase
MKRAAAFGYVACDVTVRDRMVAYSAGGTSANVSANMAVLGWQVKLHARLGVDTAGRLVQDDLKNDGVELSGACVDPEVSTPVVIVVPNSRVPKYKFKCPHCGTPYARHRPAREVDESVPHDIDVVFIDRASATSIRVAEQAREMGRTVFFEPNGLGSPRMFERLISAAHLVKFSYDRATDFLPFLSNASAEQVQICTLGKEGFALRHALDDWLRFPAPATTAIDTVGAGDMFTAALLDIWLDLRNSTTPRIDEIVDAAVEAQWFAVAQVKRPGARGLTRGRSRDEVLADVKSVRAGDDKLRAEREAWTSVPFDECESWLCRNLAGL